MKFLIRDRDGEFLPSEIEVDSLEGFMKWSIAVDFPRFFFVPPRSKHGGVYNDSDTWLIYCHSDYD
jgi:hypothetical protein